MKIKLTTVLKDLEEKMDTEGKLKTFSIKFIKKNGEVVYYHRAITCGINWDQGKHAQRGVVPVDQDGKEIGHPTPVWIWSIIEYNGNEVVLK